MFNSSLWIAVASIVLFSLAIWKAYDIGHDKASAECQSRVAEIRLQIQQEYLNEMERLQAANETSRRQQEELAKELQEKEALLDDLLAELEQEAADDPEAGSCGISEGAAERLNRIQ